MNHHHYLKAAAVQRYIELENVGHCPNHEAPNIVGHIATRWTRSKRNYRHPESLILLEEEGEGEGDEKVEDNVVRITKQINDNGFVVQEPWGHIVAREISHDKIQLSLMEKIITSMI